MHVTVTIPAYDHGHFVGRAIESVLAQDHRDLDVVVVDDASPDDTFEVASRYAEDPRVRCVRNERNLGVVGNWNRCLELAEGPLVMVFGDDDLLDPGYLARASRVFEEHPGVGLVHAPVRLIDFEGQVIDERRPREERLYRAGDEAVGSLIRSGICTATTVLRRTCYEALGNYREEIVETPDIEFTARVAARYDVYDLGTIGGSFRMHQKKAGFRGYLRDDLLDTYMNGHRLTWEHLSPEARRRLGVDDLDAFIARDGARFALDGALVCVAYGEVARARHYVARAAELDPRLRLRRRYWQAQALLAVPALGCRVMRRRMKIESGGARFDPRGSAA